MKIKSMTKTADLVNESVTLDIQIVIDAGDINVDYEGFDLLPDWMIPDVLLALSRKYNKKFKRGKKDGIRS